MNIPTWTRDTETMKRDIEKYGYCLFKEALTLEKLFEAQDRTQAKQGRPKEPDLGNGPGREPIHHRRTDFSWRWRKFL